MGKEEKNNKKLRKEDFLKDLNISRSTFFSLSEDIRRINRSTKRKYYSTGW